MEINKLIKRTVQLSAQINWERYPKQPGTAGRGKPITRTRKQSPSG